MRGHARADTREARRLGMPSQSGPHTDQRRSGVNERIEDRRRRHPTYAEMNQANNNRRHRDVGTREEPQQSRVLEVRRPTHTSTAHGK
jgi:hypothetical protein